MGWLRDHLFAVSMVVFIVSGIVSALVIGYVGLLVASAFWSGELTVSFLLGLAPSLVILAVLLVVTALSGVSLGWAVLRRLSLPRGKRLYPLIERLERRNSKLDTLGLSKFVEPPEPSKEEKVDEVKQQYVEGTINEDEFEREIERLTSESNKRDDEPFRARNARSSERER